MAVRFLHIGDTHLGAEYPLRARVKRERRGEDFFRNYELALQVANNGEVDFVIHSGDLFNRSKPPMEVIMKAYESLHRVARNGVPVFLVPGNHERSFFPGGLLLSHPNIHVFYEPDTFTVTSGNVKVAVSGFPFVRRNSRKRFGELVSSCLRKHGETDIRILAVHQVFDTAVVGPHGYVFREGDHVVPREKIPVEFSYTAAGHVHPHQTLYHPITGVRNICYAGSIDRISFAERLEQKGYILGEICSGGIRTQFFKLPVRPMILYEWQAQDLDSWEIRSRLESVFEESGSLAICRIRINGPEEKVQRMINHTRHALREFPSRPCIQVMNMRNFNGMKER